MQNYIHRARQLCQAPSHRLPQTAAHAVAVHRTAQRFAHCEAYTRARLIAPFTVKHGYIPGNMFLALPVDSLKVGMLQQPRTLGEPPWQWLRSVVHSPAQSPLISPDSLFPETGPHGNALPSFRAAPGQYRPAAFGLHACAKTVRLGTAATVGLKRALGH